jgi:hypothetical protein
VTLHEFRNLVRREFGGDLRYMTPSNARDFLDRVQSRVDAAPPAGERITLNEPEASYEGIVHDFLLRVLEMPPDQAVIRLWLYSLEMTLAGINEIEAERFRKLFAELGAE